MSGVGRMKIMTNEIPPLEENDDGTCDWTIDINGIMYKFHDVKPLSWDIGLKHPVGSQSMFSVNYEYKTCEIMKEDEK